MNPKLGTRRPAPLRIKSVRELAPSFRPRWVRLRRFAVALVFAAVLLAPVLVAPILTGMVMLIAMFFVMPNYAFPMLDLLMRPFPRAGMALIRFHSWLELDLDYNEGRP